MAGIRVKAGQRQHGPDLDIRNQLVSQLVRITAGHHQMMQRLVFSCCFLRQIFCWKHRTLRLRFHFSILVGSQSPESAQNIDFVDGDPILHLGFIAFEKDFAVAEVEIDHLPVCPAAVFFRQPKRHVEMKDSHNRFDAMLQAFVENIIIELQACFVRLCLVAVRENSCPGNRKTVAVEAHLRHQSDVFFVAVVEVRRILARIIFALFQDRLRTMRQRFP
ncbi:hypothetical protein SDC9_86789 [bioreactor metagenome]|uniref:Uncharacterized protein n=1 Tax=bioreactor metagenome TaxID=1076179 RepID=A0A644ZH17_9ZZZZ